LLLEIDFEGVKYSWTGRTWVDQRLVRVPTVLASRLARLVADDGLVLPAFTDGEGHVRSSNQNGSLDYEVAHDNHLVVGADFLSGWRKYRHDWGTILQARLSLVGVKSMLIRFNAFSTDRTPPVFDGESVFSDREVRLSVLGTRIRMDIPLLDLSGERFNPKLGWSQSKQGNAYAIRKLNLQGLRLSLLLVISPPGRQPERTYRDWHRRFWPGGLPGSSRRH
jgi:hypothetical protein